MGLEEYGPEVKPLAGARRRLVRIEKKAAGTLKRKRRKKQPKIERVARTAKARVAALVKRAADRPVTLDLTMPHWVNGVAYGPGTVTVSADMARGFEENERRVKQNDANTFGGGRAAFIGPGGRRIPVPYDSMSSPALNMIEAFSL